MDAPRCDTRTWASAGRAPHLRRRNMIGFKDGTANLKAEDAAAGRDHVWVQPGDSPAWMTGGPYLVSRRIRMLIELGIALRGPNRNEAWAPRSTNSSSTSVVECSPARPGFNLASIGEALCLTAATGRSAGPGLTPHPGCTRSTVRGHGSYMFGLLRSWYGCGFKPRSMAARGCELWSVHGARDRGHVPDHHGLPAPPGLTRALAFRGVFAYPPLGVGVIAVMFSGAVWTTTRRIHLLGAGPPAAVSCAAGAGTVVAIIIGIPALSQDLRSIVAVSGIVSEERCPRQPRPAAACSKVSSSAGRRSRPGCRSGQPGGKRCAESRALRPTRHSFRRWTRRAPSVLSPFPVHSSVR